MDITFRFPLMLVFIVLSSLMMHVGLGKKHQSTGKTSTTTKRNGETTDHASKSTDETTTNMQTPNGTIIKAKIPSSISPASKHNKHANQEDDRSKIDLTLAVALVIIAFCFGVIVMAVILCCIPQKWRSRVPGQRTHNASKSFTERSDAVLLMSDINIQTVDSVYSDLIDREILSANNAHVNRGAEQPERRVPSAPSDYEIAFERGNQRSSLEHPYSRVSVDSNVYPIAANQTERNETNTEEGKHDYFLLALNAADGENATEGSETIMIEENHDYFVHAPHEHDGEDDTERNDMGMGKKNHD